MLVRRSGRGAFWRAFVPGLPRRRGLPVPGTGDRAGGRPAPAGRRRRLTAGPADGRPPDPLELSGPALERLVEAAIERIARHVDSLPEQPAADLDAAAGAELARRLSEPLPEEGRPYEELLDLVVGELAPRSFNTAGPGYLAYIPGGGLLHAAVADLVADAINRYTGVFAAAPGLVQLEANVVDWLRAIVGLPASARGVLTSGGSLATFGALVTAREALLGEAFADGVLYASDQVHHCMPKAARLAGFPAAAVRLLPSDERFRLSPLALAAAIAEDRRAGRRPFLVAASAGTVNTGAVDPLPELAELARREGLWLHVDGAYGGCFALTERGRRTLAGIEGADSIVLDPHKGFFLPYGTGALLVRDGEALRRAHSQGADYLPRLQDGLERIDFCELSAELSKPFRGLRLWLPLKMAGAAAFRAALDEKLDLAAWIASELTRLPDLDLVAAPELSLLAFRVRLPGRSAEREDTATRRLLDAVNARQRVHLTGTRAHGRFLARICVLSFRTHRDRMEQCLEDIQAALPVALA